jgi:hypothetical protein
VRETDVEEREEGKEGLGERVEVKEKIDVCLCRLG